MKKRTYPQWIDGYARETYALAKSHDASTHMPFNPMNFHPLFDDLWVEKFYDAVTRFNNSGMAISEVMRYLPVHSSLKFNLLEMIVFLKTSNTNSQKARTIIDFFLKTIRQRAVNKNFWEDNLILEYRNANKVIKEKKLVKADRFQASEVAKIVAGCGSLAHGLYNDFCTDYGYDVFGPYNLSSRAGKEKLSLFVRQFSDLKPELLWPKFKNFPLKTVKVYAVYKGINSQSHYIGCHMVYKESVIDSLVKFQVEIDGKFISSLSELREIREIVLNAASNHYVGYKKLNFEQQKKMYLRQFGYQFKDFFDLFNINWRPSRKMIDRVKNKKLVDYFSDYDVDFRTFREKEGVDYLINIYSNKN